MQVDVRRAIQFAPRAALIVVLIAAGWNVFHRLLAQRYLLGNTDIAGISKALAWDSSTPDYHFQYGLAWRDLPNSQDLAQAEQSLLRAASLNPFAWRYWIELALCYELRQKRDQAEKAYLRAIELNPRSGEFYWRLANSYLRWGERESALGKIELALERDLSLRHQTLDLLTRSEFSLKEVLDIWPSDQASRLHLINYYVTNPIQGLDDRDLLSVYWEDLLSSESPPTISQGSFYIRHLLQTAPFEAREEWIRLLRRNGLQDTDYETFKNQVWNGHFETEVSGGPLDWYCHPSDNSAISRVKGEGFESSTALRIDFKGADTPSFGDLGVILLTRPGESHSLSFRARSQEITSDEGVYFQLIESSTGRVLVESVKILGTTPWTQYQESFRAPAESMLARLELRRNPSQRIDNRLSGTVWIDEVSVRAY